MTAFLGNIGAFFTEAISWVTELIAAISASPELTVVVFAMGISGFAIGALRRLIRL